MTKLTLTINIENEKPKTLEYSSLSPGLIDLAKIELEQYIEKSAREINTKKILNDVFLSNQE